MYQPSLTLIWSVHGSSEAGFLSSWSQCNWKTSRWQLIVDLDCSHFEIKCLRDIGVRIFSWKFFKSKEYKFFGGLINYGNVNCWNFNNKHLINTFFFFLFACLCLRFTLCCFFVFFFSLKVSKKSIKRKQVVALFVVYVYGVANIFSKLVLVHLQTFHQQVFLPIFSSWACQVWQELDSASVSIWQSRCVPLKATPKCKANMSEDWQFPWDFHFFVRSLQCGLYHFRFDMAELTGSAFQRLQSWSSLPIESQLSQSKTEICCSCFASWR